MVEVTHNAEALEYRDCGKVQSECEEPATHQQWVCAANSSSLGDGGYTERLRVHCNPRYAYKVDIDKMLTTFGGNGSKCPKPLWCWEALFWTGKTTGEVTEVDD